MSAAEDRALIRELVENWVVWRDAGDWERFATVWHDDGFMMATWFQGPATEFIRVSREGFERGVSILHFLGGTSIDLAGDDARDRADQDDDLPARRGPRRRPATSSAPAASTTSSSERERPLGHRPAPADLREGPARPARPGGDA